MLVLGSSRLTDAVEKVPNCLLTNAPLNDEKRAHSWSICPQAQYGRTVSSSRDDVSLHIIFVYRRAYGLKSFCPVMRKDFFDSIDS
jgi:hypothetical protein